jgi:hypothetical protein
MAGDTNFCDGRLRLTAFLRVMEHGLPQRPSRFKRRVPRAGEDYRGTAATDRAESGTVSKTSGNPEKSPSLAADAGLNLPHCPPPPAEVTIDESNTIPDRTLTEQRKTKVDKARLLEMESIAHPRQANEHLTAGYSRPSSTRKRRLTVKGLALVRTTTSNGLPDPVV